MDDSKIERNLFALAKGFSVGQPKSNALGLKR